MLRRQDHLQLLLKYHRAAARCRSRPPDVRRFHADQVRAIADRIERNRKQHALPTFPPGTWTDWVTGRGATAD